MYEEINQLDYMIPIRLAAVTIPESLLTADSKYESTLISNIHLHKEYEFLRINKGIMRCVTVDGEFYAGEGDIIFINSYTPHSTYHETTDSHHTLLQFRLPSNNDSLIKYISRFSDISGKSAVVFKNRSDMTKNIHQYFDAIIDEYTHKKPYWSDYIYANLLSLMATLRRNKILSDTVNIKAEEINKLRPILEYIEQNYSKELSTLSLSQMLNFNETYFCRLFKNIVGTTPVNYINYVRICEAEKLLRKDMGISAVAEQTGFSSLSYFNRTFKKYNHYNPREYKKILKHQEYEY